MAAKRVEISKKDKWWETDSAKTVATIIAVLLIPMAVVAWTVFSKSEFNTNTETQSEEIAPSSDITEAIDYTDIQIEDVTIEDNAPQESNTVEDVFINKMEEKKDTLKSNIDMKKEEKANEEEITEAQPSEKLNLKELLTNLRDNNESNEPTNTENNEEISEPVEEEMANEEESLIDQLLDSREARESENTEMDETANVGDNNEFTGDRELGGMLAIDKLETLPDTASTHKYVVKSGDNVYKISIKVCNDQSFYLNNLYRNYLKVGETIEVSCN